ncbi:MAG: hypothetical protein ACFB21_05315 [Opitutales bacterium]
MRKPTNPEIRYEIKDFGWKTAAALGLGLLVLVGGMMTGLWWIYRKPLADIRPAEDARYSFSFTEAPERASAIEQEREALWELERERLSASEPLSETGDIRQIPLEAAMTAVAEQGVPVWGPVETPQTSPYKLTAKNE